MESPAVDRVHLAASTSHRVRQVPRRRDRDGTSRARRFVARDDRSDSSQGSLNAALEALFGISTGFAGTMGSQVVKTMGLKSFAEGVNEKHMEAWGELCKGAGILNTPLTAHLDAELLKQNHLAVDGRAIEATGFAYSVPQLTAASLRPQIDAYIAQKLFPPVL